MTAKRIARVCGSVEAFLADPSKFRYKFQEPNVKWMCTVSIQEAQISLERMLAWAKSDKRPSGGSLGKWIFYRDTLQNQHVETIPEVPDIIMSKTLNAAQRNWRVPSEFPCCPQENAEEPITAYSEKLKTGSVFCRNDVFSSLVSKSAISYDRQSLYVISESTEGKNALKPWALAKITYENGLFVHTSLHNFFTQEGVEKQYCLENIKRADPGAANINEFYYILAGISAFREEKGKAYENLRIFNKNEKSCWLLWVTLIKNDPFFNNIRNEPEFQQIVRDLESEYQVEHEG